LNSTTGSRIVSSGSFTSDLRYYAIHVRAQALPS
jgi:hypothetical protein